MWPSSGWICAGMEEAWQRTRTPLGRQARVVQGLVGLRHSFRCCSADSSHHQSAQGSRALSCCSGQAARQLTAPHNSQAGARWGLQALEAGAAWWQA